MVPGGTRATHPVGERLSTSFAYTVEIVNNGAEQVQLVRNARAVAGYAGSAMFTTAFAGAPKHVIVVGPESYPAHNEYMLASLVGHDLDLVLCRPEVPREDGWTMESFHSDYVYDPQREGVFLRSAIADEHDGAGMENGRADRI